MNTFRALILSLAVAASPAAAASEQFNLRCTGKLVETATLSRTTDTDYEIIYRVDLAAGKWCKGQCDRILGVVVNEPTHLVLTDLRDVSRTRENTVMETIDRRTGEHEIRIVNETYGRNRFSARSTWQGICEPEPFTGFLENPTKF